MSARALTVIIVAATASVAAWAHPPARTKLFASGLQNPLFVTHIPGDNDHVFVVERPGRIKVAATATGVVNPVPVLDITALVNLDAENGLLGLAFDPDHANNGYFYINYRTHDGFMVLARYHLPSGTFVADPMSQYTIWKHPHALGHNGGWIGFSPVNGLLYVSRGDGDLGGSYDAANRAQDITDEPLGKILRIDPSGDDHPEDPDRNYRIPAGNPFVGAPGDDEIWAYGLRNPWRCSFDRATGDLWIGDVGFVSWEEINREPASSPGGRNYGWPCMEGAQCTGETRCVCNGPGLTLPEYDYSHQMSGRSVTCGYVYRGTTIPSFAGLFFFADFQIGRIYSFRPGTGAPTEFTDRTDEFIPAGTSAPINWIAGFGEDAAGELYICNVFDGKIYRMERYPCSPVVDVPPSDATMVAGSTMILGVIGAGDEPISYQWRKDGVDLLNGARVSGAQSDELRISRLEESDEGQYDVVLVNACGSAISDPAALSVEPCPSGDFNGDSLITVQDLFDFLGAWMSRDFTADFDGNLQITVQDLFSFLFSWLSRCP